MQGGVGGEGLGLNPRAAQASVIIQILVKLLFS